jgi:hypothetical protein
MFRALPPLVVAVLRSGFRGSEFIASCGGKRRHAIVVGKFWTSTGALSKLFQLA